MSAIQPSLKRSREPADDGGGRGGESDAPSSSSLSDYGSDFDDRPTSSRFLRPADSEADRSSSSYNGPMSMTMQTEVGRENVGYGLLVKMGWKGAGTGLGREGEGACLLSFALDPSCFLGHAGSMPAPVRRSYRRADDLSLLPPPSARSVDLAARLLLPSCRTDQAVRRRSRSRSLRLDSESANLDRTHA